MKMIKIPMNATVLQHTTGTNFVTTKPDHNGNVVVSNANAWSFIRSAPPKTIRLSTKLVAAVDQGLSPDNQTARLVAYLDTDLLKWNKDKHQFETTLHIGYTNQSKSNVEGVSIHLETHGVEVSNHVIEPKQENLLTPVTVYSATSSSNAWIDASGNIVAGQRFEIAMEPVTFSNQTITDLFRGTFSGPVIFLMVVGSGAGGILRAFRARKSRHPWYWHMGQACIAGPLIVALVVGLGVSLPIGSAKNVLTSPWTLLAVAAVGGFGGAALFAKLSKMDGKRRR
jgi:hypothetical protein